MRNPRINHSKGWEIAFPMLKIQREIAPLSLRRKYIQTNEIPSKKEQVFQPKEECYVGNNSFSRSKILLQRRVDPLSTLKQWKFCYFHLVCNFVKWTNIYTWEEFIYDSLTIYIFFNYWRRWIKYPFCVAAQNKITGKWLQAL